MQTVRGLVKSADRLVVVGRSAEPEARCICQLRREMLLQQVLGSASGAEEPGQSRDSKHCVHAATQGTEASQPVARGSRTGSQPRLGASRRISDSTDGARHA